MLRTGQTSSRTWPSSARWRIDKESGAPSRAPAIKYCRRPGWQIASVATVVVVVTITVEQVEQITDRRHAARHVLVVLVPLGIGQVVAAALAERSAELERYRGCGAFSEA
jgi:hypothetical protein